MPRELKYSVRISDFPIPCRPTSMMLWLAGIRSRSCRSSVVFTLMLDMAIRIQKPIFPFLESHLKVSMSASCT